MATITFLDQQVVTFSDSKSIMAIGVTLNKKMIPIVPNTSTKSLDAVMKEGQKQASLAVAKVARKRMSSWFNPSSKTYVGIGSKRTAAGLSVLNKPIGGNPGQVLISIQERRNSLRIIRQGLKPGSSGPHQKQAAFFRWLDEKEIADDGPDRKTEEETRRSTMYRIANHVFQHGISKYWAKLPVTGGRNYFNYPQYYSANYADQDMESVAHALFVGDPKSGFQAAIASVSFGALSSAMWQVNGTQKLSDRTHLTGSVKGSGGSDDKARFAKVWSKADFYLLSSDRDLDTSFDFAKDGNDTWNYVQMVRKKMKRFKKSRSK